MVNSFHYVPVWKGYMVACGEAPGSLIQSHRLKDKSDQQLKNRSLHKWMVGSVILHPGIAREVQVGTIRYLHDTLRKLTTDLTHMEEASIAVRDGIC
jgi:hypothetical protein